MDSSIFRLSSLVSSEKSLYIAIADHIEALIVSQELQHNQKLPSTAQLAQYYGVALTTTQQALARLHERGLVRRKPKLGTIVNNVYGKRCVAVVFSFAPLELESRYYGLFLRALEKNLISREMDYVIHFGLIHERFHAALKRLKNEIQAGDYSCILSVIDSQEFYAWSTTQQIIPCFRPAMLDLRQSVREGMTNILKRGYRRILFLSMYNSYNEPVRVAEAEGLQDARDCFPEQELEAQNWGISIHEAYSNAKEFFSKRPRQNWPEAVFSHHDVVTKGLLIALTEMGIRVPQDLALVSHSNQGDEFSFPVTIARIEVNPALLAEQTVKNMLVALAGCALGTDTLREQLPSLWIEGESLPAQKRFG